jgi:hypothetical protein
MMDQTSFEKKVAKMEGIETSKSDQQVENMNNRLKGMLSWPPLFLVSAGLSNLGVQPE